MGEKIPKGWKKVKLGEVAEIQNGYAFKSKDFNDTSGIPIIKIKNIATGKLDMSDITYYNKPLDNLDKFIVKKGDILIAMTGSHIHQPSSMVGRVARYLSEEISLLNQRVGKIYSINKNIDEDFLFYFLKCEDITYKLAVNASGSANQANISSNMIKSLEILLPPLPEQKAIAGILSSLDDKIDLLHRQNKTLEEMAQTLFRKWFIEPCKDGIPEGWEEKKLENYFELLSGYSFKSKDFVEIGKYKIITIKNVQNGFLDDSKTSYINILPKNLNDYQILNIGDIIMSLTGNVGRTCIVDIDNCLLNQRVAKVVSKIPKLKAFTYFYFKRSSMLERLENLAKGSAQLNLSPVETLKQLDLFPPDYIINSLNNYLQPIFNKILKNKLQIRTLEKLRDTLLPKLMSGEVRVKYE